MADCNSVASNLTAMLSELGAKRLASAVRAAVQKEATMLKRKAASKLRSSGVANAKEIAREIRGKASRDGMRMIVAADFNARKKRGMYTSRRSGKEKPVLYWLDNGSFRQPNGIRKTRGGKRKAHSTGKLTGMHFIRATEREELQGSMDRIAKNFAQKAEKIISKYGNK